MMSSEQAGSQSVETQCTERNPELFPFRSTSRLCSSGGVHRILNRMAYGCFIATGEISRKRYGASFFGGGIL